MLKNLDQSLSLLPTPSLFGANTVKRNSLTVLEIDRLLRFKIIFMYLGYVVHFIIKTGYGRYDVRKLTLEI